VLCKFLVNETIFIYAGILMLATHCMAISADGLLCEGIYSIPNLKACENQCNSFILIISAKNLSAFKRTTFFKICFLK
jgi:hypothetical protein